MPPHPPFSLTCPQTSPLFTTQPLLLALRPHLDALNAKNYAALPAFHTPSFTFISATGKASVGSAAAVAAMRSDLTIFDDFYYEVAACTGAPTGETTFRFVAVGRLFVDLIGGEEGRGTGEAMDEEGTSWDCVGEGAWVFDCVEGSEGGWKFERMQVFMDSTPILGEAVRRGVVPLESLLG